MSNLQLQEQYNDNYLFTVDQINQDYENGYISIDEAEEAKGEARVSLGIALEAAELGFANPEDYLVALYQEAEEEGLFEDDEEAEYGVYDNLTNFSSDNMEFSDVLLNGLLNVYGEDDLEAGVYDLAELVGVDPANVVDWVEGNDVPDLEETDLIAEAFEADDDQYIELQALTAYERGEDLEEYLYDDEDDIVEDVVDAVDVVNSKAEYALAKIQQAEFNSAVVSELNDILSDAEYCLTEGFITPKEYDTLFTDLADYSNEDKLAVFSAYCSSEGRDEASMLDQLRYFLDAKKSCGRVLNYTQYSREDTNAEFSREKDEDYHRIYARQLVSDLI